MRDLSFDDAPAEADSAPAHEADNPEDVQAAERRRMIDADS
jgi:hypothetical protein